MNITVLKSGDRLKMYQDIEAKAWNVNYVVTLIQEKKMTDSHSHNKANQWPLDYLLDASELFGLESIV